MATLNKATTVFVGSKGTSVKLFTTNLQQKQRLYSQQENSMTEYRWKERKNERLEG